MAETDSLGPGERQEPCVARAARVVAARRGLRQGPGRRTASPVRPVSSARAEVVAVFGPTASGKSAVAEAVAERLGTEVVSADAMQVYRGLPILTNQPSTPTRLVGIRALDEEMSVGAFAELAHREIDALVHDRGAAVVCGGTGLYLRAALADLDVPPAVHPETRARVAREVDRRPARRASPARGPGSRRGRGRPSPRSQAPRPGARACRRGSVARREPGSALGGEPRAARR